MKWKAVGLSLLAGVLGLISPAWADGTAIFHDSFNDLTQVDTQKTTAYVDTGQGWVELWHPSQATAISVDQSDTNIPSNIVVADAAGVQWYSYDQATGKMMNNTTLGYNYTNPLGVSLVPQTMSYYVFTKEGGDTYSVKQATFDGTSMVDNPLMTVTGLNDLVTISAVDTSHVAVADKQGQINVYSQGVLDTTHSFNTGLANIQSVVNIPGTWNFVVVTSDSAYQYVFDQSTGTYVKNTAYTVNSGNQTIVSGATTDGNLVDLLTPTQNDAYIFDQATNTMAQAGIYTIGGLSKAVAVGLPSDQAVVIADQDGNVHTYQLNGSTFTENTNLLIQGLTFSKDYHSPGIYQSKAITPPSPNNMFEIVPTEQDDPGTSIIYSLSVDGGNTFTPVQPNQWIHLPAGTTNPPAGANVPPGPYIIQATLTSPDSNHTPRLTDIVLNAYLDVTPPRAPGQPTAKPNPSGQTTTHITWSPSSDVVSAPSTGASGVAKYQIRFSTDGGKTWGGWMDTKSNQPGYDLQVPEYTAATYAIQVRAIDAAGNIGPESPVGNLFVDTIPLGLASSLMVTNIIYPTPGQTFPTNVLPVHVQAGGEVIYEITTTGGAQAVHVEYSDGTSQDLVPKDSTLQDVCRWEGWYYPSSTSTIPLNTPQGTYVWITKITVSGLGKQPYETSSDLLVVDGSISRGMLPQMAPRLVQ